MAGLFGSSGARGLVNIDITPVLACKVGLAVTSHIKPRIALVERDTRVSGSMLEDSLVSGLLAGGVCASLVGAVPTPVLAYLTMLLKARALTVEGEPLKAANDIMGRGTALVKTQFKELKK